MTVVLLAEAYYLNCTRYSHSCLSARTVRGDSIGSGGLRTSIKPEASLFLVKPISCSVLAIAFRKGKLWCLPLFFFFLMAEIEICGLHWDPTSNPVLGATSGQTLYRLSRLARNVSSTGGEREKKGLCHYKRVRGSRLVGCIHLGRLYT